MKPLKPFRFRAPLLLCGPFVLALALDAGQQAEAKLQKYVYLKMGGGENASVYAFTSRSACEAGRRHEIAFWTALEKSASYKTDIRRKISAVVRARCIDRLPVGYVRP
jgi:hypothetical protein